MSQGYIEHIASNPTGGFNEAWLYGFAVHGAGQMWVPYDERGTITITNAEYYVMVIP